MVNKDLQKYWTLVTAHRRGKESALVALRLLAKGFDRGAQQAKRYVLHHDNHQQERTAIP